MMYLLFILIWGLYTLIEGYREGYYWHYKMHTLDNSDNIKRNLHVTFTLQRTLVLVLLFVVFSSFINIYATFWVSLANLLIFTFIHNGMMYTTRNSMSKVMFPTDETKWLYPKGWFDQSVTSTAKATKYMTPVSRTIQFCLGLVIYIMTIIEYTIW